MARAGFTAGTQGIEGKNGFGQVMSTRFDPSELTHQLGERFEIVQNMYKPYACGLVLHAAIFGVLELRRTYPRPWQEIESIQALVGPLVQELTSIAAPSNELESKFSVFHALAVAAIRGSAGVDDFSDVAVNDADVGKLRSRVQTKIDTGLHKLEAQIRITYSDGAVFEKHVHRAPGSLDHPLSQPDLEGKFRSLAKRTLSSSSIERIIEKCAGLPASNGNSSFFSSAFFGAVDGAGPIIKS